MDNILRTHTKAKIGVMLAITFTTLTIAVQFAYAVPPGPAGQPPWAASNPNPTIPPGPSNHFPPDPCANAGVCIPPGLAGRVAPPPS